MLRAVVAVTAVTFSIGLAARAGAEPRAAHPQPTPSALSPATPEGTGDKAGALVDPIWEAVKGKQDAFDRRITEKSRRVARSICTGCDAPSASVHAKAPRRKEAAAGDRGDDYVVDEPDGAPIE